MSVKSIMSTRIVTVEMDDRLAVVRDIFANTKFHHLLVVEHGKLRGVVSDRDLLKVVSPKIGTAAETAKDAQTLQRRVHQIMTRKPVRLTETAPISEAIDVFLDNRISCIPIVDAGERPVGILSWRDILAAMRGNLRTAE